MDALLANPDYESNWDALYRDFIRLQRVDEQLNGACDSIRARPTDAPAAAAWIRDKPATNGGDGKAPPTFADVIAGSIELDDITPIYTANLFSMITKTYDGANALPVALELSRRTDFGAWFDSAYLNRDQTCLGCHNSEFSVTFSADASKNRWFPVPGLFEKALFGSSTGGATVGGFTGADREHAVLRYSQMLNINPAKDQTDCAAASASVIAAAKTAGTLPNCASGDGVFQCMSDGALLCASTAKRQRLVQPWGMATGVWAVRQPAKPAHRSGLRREQAGQHHWLPRLDVGRDGFAPRGLRQARGRGSGRRRQGQHCRPRQGLRVLGVHEHRGEGVEGDHRYSADHCQLLPA